MGPKLMYYLLVALGGALGALGRNGVAALSARYWPDAPHWGTLVVNITGCLIMGFLYGLRLADGSHWLGESGRAFLMVGILGGYTTFSAFSLQTLVLALEVSPWKAALNILLSVALCLFAVWAGYKLASDIRIGV